MRAVYPTITLVAVAWLTQAPQLQADSAILIGGGYNLQGSQGQIELNTQWVQSILNDHALDVTTFYTDGDNPSDDVHYLQLAEKYKSSMEPLARIYNNLEQDKMVYRNHEVDNVTSGTQRDILIPQLQEKLSDNTTDTLLIYNGHGNQSISSPDKVTMHLWGDTIIQADEIHGMLETNNAPFRFVMTQCYSGGFHRLAYQNSAQGLALAEGAPRCGFTAESAYRLSEGCSSSINTADYRDYTTYFFAALTGTDRNGQPLQTSADTNNDGSTTLREAHLHTLTHAVSTDLPRSTSEDYLHIWQPWHLRWTPTDAQLPDNEYAQIYAQLAQRFDINPIADDAPRQIQQQLNDINSQREELEGRFFNTAREIRIAQSSLQQSLIAKWPALNAPYTKAFVEKTTAGLLEDVSSYAATLDDYPSLVSAQNALAILQDQILDNERHLTQLQKLQHLRRLAMLQGQLNTHGSVQEIADYNALLACEDSDL